MLHPFFAALQVTWLWKKESDLYLIPYIFQSLIQTFGSATISACKTPHVRRTLFSLPLATLPWTAHKKQNKKKARVFSCFQADSSLGKGPNYSEIFWDNSTFHALHVDVTTFWCHMENSSFFTTVVMSYIFASDKPCFLANKCWEDYGDLRRLLRKDRATNSLRRFARKKGEGVLQERYTDLLRPSINIYILYKYM